MTQFAPQKLRIAVVGDIIYDRYLRGSAERLSPEAPVPVVNIEKEQEHLGGAANVAQNLRAMGIQTDLFGVVGVDVPGDRIQELCEGQGIGHDGVVRATGRCTTEKVRVMAGHHQVVRYDKEDREALDGSEAGKISRKLQAGNYDAVIISDYGKGVISAPLIEAAIASSSLVTVDPVPAHAAFYGGCSLITPNQKEFKALCEKLDIVDDDVESLPVLQQAMGLRDGILLTRGPHGLLWVSGDEHHAFPALFRPVFDVTGAGDTVIAVFTAVLAAGFSARAAAAVANKAGSEVVGQVGTATVDQAFIQDQIEAYEDE